MSQSRNFDLEIQFALRSASSSAVWSACHELLKEADLLEPEYTVWAEKRKRRVDRMEPRVGKEPHSLSVHGERIRIDMGGGGYFISVLDIVRPDGGTLAWEKWLAALAPVGQFVCARLIDVEYDRWENETRPDVFALHDRSTAGLKLVWDPDLRENLVDTSSNPGRRVGRKGYSEALGATMWLSWGLVNLVGTDRDALQALGATTKEHTSWLELQLSDRPFDADNPVTEALRKAVFPKAIPAV